MGVGERGEWKVHLKFQLSEGCPSDWLLSPDSECWWNWHGLAPENLQRLVWLCSQAQVPPGGFILGREEKSECLVFQLSEWLHKRLVCVSPDLGCWWGSWYTWMPGGRWERRTVAWLAAAAPKSLQYCRRTPEGDIMRAWKIIWQPSLVGKSHTQAQRSGTPRKGVRAPPKICKQADWWRCFPVWGQKRWLLFFQMHKTQQNVRRHTSMVYRKKQDKSPETKKNGHLRITYQRIKNDRSSMIYKTMQTTKWIWENKASTAWKY